MADTLQQLLRERAEQDTVAVKYGDRSWTWREHIAEAKAQAATLIARADPGRPLHVGVLLGNTPEMLTALAAAALGGYVLCGINTTRRGDGLARDIARVDCQILITDADHRHLLDGVDLSGVTVLDTSGARWSQLLAGAPPLTPHREVGADDTFGKPLAYILATPERPDDHDNPLRNAFGNEAADRDIEEFGRRFGCTVWDGFGSTEIAVIITRPDDTPSGAVGKGFPGVAIYNPDTLRECDVAQFDDNGALINADAAVGELVNTSGSGLFRGYYNDPGATNKVLKRVLTARGVDPDGRVLWKRDGTRFVPVACADQE
jgi:acyl-CoA synthetase (AMP-forming)/AMP-acid ligase II